MAQDIYMGGGVFAGLDTGAPPLPGGVPSPGSNGLLATDLSDTNLPPGRLPRPSMAPERPPRASVANMKPLPPPTATTSEPALAPAPILIPPPPPSPSERPAGFRTVRLRKSVCDADSRPAGLFGRARRPPVGVAGNAVRTTKYLHNPVTALPKQLFWQFRYINV